jgi:quinol monooxygenase YgiN
MMIARLILKVLPEKRNAAIDILRSVQLALGIRQEVLLCKVYENSEDGEILFIEQWRTKEALYRHIQSDLYRRILEVMELAKLPPDLCFFDVSEIEGLDLVITLRQPVI